MNCIAFLSVSTLLVLLIPGLVFIVWIPLLTPAPPALQTHTLCVFVAQLLCEDLVGRLPVSLLLQGTNSGMCLRRTTEISLITFIVLLC